jgi:hypothetical protein
MAEYNLLFSLAFIQGSAEIAFKGRNSLNVRSLTGNW